MTKKDYVLIARVLQSLHDESGDALVSLDDVIAAIADALAAENFRFNRVTFVKACR